MMGLFADLKHAWVSIDNAIYMWDYTHPEPQLVGFEEQRNPITAVCMATPRPGVFTDTVSRLLVVATTVEIIVIGLSIVDAPGGARTISLFRTNMAVPVRGLNVICLKATPDGRIFFTGTAGNDVYEITYQQEERWFYNRCSKINHTTSRLAMLTPSFTFGVQTAAEHTVQMAVDEHRRLLYTLSSDSTIRAFHLRDGNVLHLAITKTFRDILNNIGHMISQTDLLTPQTRLISINPISSREATRLHVVAVTSSGCRIFLSATSSYGFLVSDSSNAPMSMQVHHVKFPPSSERGSATPQVSSAPGAVATVNTTSRSLLTTRNAVRYSPGSFFCLVSKEANPAVDELFISAPDTGRIARPQDPNAVTRFPELGIWLSLNSRAEDIGIVTSAPSPSDKPEGAANEMATQFERPRTEIAILTNSGIHCLQRQRLVDIFVNAIRSGRTDDGQEGTIKRFIRVYGRTETAATALAVACGQGFESTSEYRVATITDPAVVEQARTTFIEYGGKPQINENMLDDRAVPTPDMVRLSPRHDGLALYVSRLVRSFWRSPVIQEATDPTTTPRFSSPISMDKLRDVQQDMVRLKEFLDANRSFIDGLAGPEALGSVSTRQQEVSLQAEHRALHALVRLIENVIEGIAFVQTMLSERMDDIYASLTDEAKKAVRPLTYEGLFASENGKNVAKELVKAIVNRNILNGANVETVADALRRKCGSFCSASDVIIFKAQEQMRRAAEAGETSELSRNLLNESLRLFTSAADSLSFEQLQAAVDQYIRMRFYGGAISIALMVAREMDRGNRALTWIQNGRPEGVRYDHTESRRQNFADNMQDPGAAIFARRRRCYDLIKQVIDALDQATQNPQDTSDEAASMSARRRKETYEVIDTSDDETFQTDLYDWYLERGLPDRLLIIQSPFVIAYLQRRSTEDIAIADLLAKFYNQKGRHYDAAAVQLDIARSGFPLSLDRRIAYLSRAKANASVQTYQPGRQNRQKLLREVSELLDVAGIQSDLIQKAREDARFINEDVRAQVIGELNGAIMPLSQVRSPPFSLNPTQRSLNSAQLYNDYVDRAGYFDIALLVYQAAEHTNAVDIRDTWRNLINAAQARAVAAPDGAAPWTVVAAAVRDAATSLGPSPSVLAVPDLLPLLKRYELTQQRGVGPVTWCVDLLLDARVPYEAVFPVLLTMLASDEQPWAQPANRVNLAENAMYVAGKWFNETSASGAVLFGDDAACASVLNAGEFILELPGVPPALEGQVQNLRRHIELRRR